MVNFRFHLVSLTAVFLALAAGITIGAGVVDRATVDQIERQLADVAERRRETNAENDRLRRELATASQFLDDAGDQLVDGALAGAPVVVVASAGVDRDLVDRFRGTLAAAGAEVDGTYWFTGRWALAEAEHARQLAAILDIAPTTSADNARAAALVAVAAAWGTGDSGALMGALADAGFLEFETAQVDVEPAGELPRPETTFVVISSATAEAAPDVVSVPLVTQLVADGRPVLAAQPTDPAPVESAEGEQPEATAPGFVAQLRDEEGDVDGALSTVDNLDDPRGRIAAVLAVRDLRARRTGHYSLGPDTRLIPEPPPAE
jgi:hypothetical protein